MNDKQFGFTVPADLPRSGPRPLRPLLAEQSKETVEEEYADFLKEYREALRSRITIPHCDELVLHAFGTCQFCDDRYDLRAIRSKHKVNDTGCTAIGWRECPSTALRPLEKIERWYGNVPAPEGGGEITEQLTEQYNYEPPEAYLHSAGEPVSAHAFNKAVDETIARAVGISNQRGSEYLDTWSLENINTVFVRHVLRMKGIPTDDLAWLRLLLAAALVDVKDTRMLGPWKQDSVDDGINYRAAFASWREAYEKETR